MTLSDQLIRCWTAGMVALTACSLALLLPLSSGSLVNIMYTPSWRGNCCLAFGGGGPGGGGGGGGNCGLCFGGGGRGGGGWGGGANIYCLSFRQLLCLEALPSGVICRLADPTMKLAWLV